MKTYPRFKAAAAHIAPVYYDTKRTIDKACDAIAEAARSGARLVAFPEVYIPGYPVWAGVVPATRTHHHFRQLAAAAIEVDGPELNQIRFAAKQNDIFVSIGFNEATKISVGCIWNSNVIIGPDGGILNHRRKLVPTFYEKLVWASGDGSGLETIDTDIGRLGILICGENTNPLARYALMAQGEQVHISTYPPVYPTKPPEDADNYDLENAIRIRAGAHCFEAKVYNIVTSMFFDATTRTAVEILGEEAVASLDNSPKAVSMIIGPDGKVIGDTLSDREGLVVAELDLSTAVEHKRIHDVVGYYNRFDVFDFKVNLADNRPIELVGKPAPANGALNGGDERISRFENPEIGMLPRRKEPQALPEERGSTSRKS